MGVLQCSEGLFFGDVLFVFLIVLFCFDFSVKEHSYIGRRLCFSMIYSNETQKDHTVKLNKIFFPTYLVKKDGLEC